MYKTTPAKNIAGVVYLSFEIVNYKPIISRESLRPCSHQDL